MNSNATKIAKADRLQDLFEAHAAAAVTRGTAKVNTLEGAKVAEAAHADMTKARKAIVALLNESTE